MLEKSSESILESFISSLNLDEEATGIVQEILREEVFQSTLDWQTSEQLLGGAIRAHDLFRRNEAFYRASARHGKSRLRVLQLEASGTSEGLKKVRREEVTARAKLNTHLPSPV
jgi:hypothetical protein